MFLQVDKSWREMMQRTEDRPNALRAATAPGVLEVLQTSNVHLEKIHKCLEVNTSVPRLHWSSSVVYLLPGDFVCLLNFNVVVSTGLP